MKKLLVTIILFSAIKIQAQNISEFKPNSASLTSYTNQTVQNLLNNFPQVDKNKIKKDSIYSLQLQTNDIVGFSFILANSSYTNMAGMLYKPSNKYALFYEKQVKNNSSIKSEIFDLNGELLYTLDINLQTNKVQMRLAPSPNVTCFKFCIDKTQDEFEETFGGWIAWNLPPHSAYVQAAAAIHCKGCCEHWWNQGCDGKLP